jgi:hypothetical protein
MSKNKKLNIIKDIIIKNDNELEGSNKIKLTEITDEINNTIVFNEESKNNFVYFQLS